MPTTPFVATPSAERLLHAGLSFDPLAERVALASLEARLFGGATTGPRASRYRLREPIGSGGSGTVFRAYDPDLDRQVAIKLLHADAGRAAGFRLVREARALARLTHPNVIEVLAVGTTDELELDAGVQPAWVQGSRGGVFLVMELVEGRTLRRILEEGERPWPEMVSLLVQAGRGLAAAHAAGLVHRDFKPENVLVGDDGRPRVLDFGLVGRSEDLASPAAPDPQGASTLLTRTGTRLGTPAYMSPEQHAAASVDARSDQYSFGVTLYEIVAGARPFGGGMKALARAKLQRRCNPGPRRIPLGLHRTIRRVLAPRASDRFPTLDDALDAVERAMRRRGHTRAVLPGLSVGALTLAVANVAFTEPEGGPAATHRLLTSSTESAGGLGDEDPLVVAARRRLGAALLELGDFEAARHHLEDATWAATSAGADGIAADAAIDLVWLLGVERGEPAEAERWARFVRAELDRRPHDPVREARLAHNLGGVQYRQGRHAEALENYLAALRVQEGLLGRHHPAVARTLNHVGNTLIGLGRLDEARAACARSLEIRRATLGARHPLVAASLNNLGAIELGRDRAEVALEHVEASLEIVAGSERPEELIAWTLAARIHRARGDVRAEFEARSRALELMDRNPSLDRSTRAEHIERLAIRGGGRVQ